MYWFYREDFFFLNCMTVINYSTRTRAPIEKTTIEVFWSISDPAGVFKGLEKIFFYFSL